MGEGESHNTSKETRAAIREGRVIRGMTKDEVELAMGEPARKIEGGNNLDMWLYVRSNGVVLDVTFDERGYVKEAKARRGDVNSEPPTLRKRKPSRQRKNVGGIIGGTMETGTPIE